MATFATRLQAALQLNNVTAAELSRKTGISEGSLSQYLKGTFTPKADKVYLISKELNVSPNWLLAYDDPEPELLAEEIKIIFNSLSTERQNQALDYLRYLVSQQDKETTPEESPGSP